MNSEIHAAVEFVDGMKLGLFCEVFGFRETEVRSKIRRKEWVEDREYTKDPDGRIHIILSGYSAWLHKNQKVIESEAEKSRSALKKKAMNNERIKPLIQPSTPIPQLV